ncbi:hypothetical protein BGZ99_005860 [Dissophora globulifera]|uniref:Uncharacterized protein n=1 Tax=Dissophora globulifera TaxID=979702 RepID=A0A9P6URW4_9FUNG|nr:hypothetical protein BGZ99_005860 [Dissophora globulifera]
MAVDLTIHFNPDGTTSVGLTLVTLILEVIKYAIVSIGSVLIYKFYSAHSRWGEAMWLRGSGGKFESLFTSGERVNGLANFSRWHVTAIGFSATLFALGLSGALLTGLFSTEPHFSDVLANNVVITAPIWNASYSAAALLSRENAIDAASGFVHLLSGTQNLNISALSEEWDPEPTNVTPLKIYTSVTTNSSTTTMKSDYVWLLLAYPVCDGLQVEYQNTSSGAFRGYPNVACQRGSYGLHVDVRLPCGTSSSIWLTGDSWGQLTWVDNQVPTAKVQQREILTQTNGSTIRVSETYSTFSSVATTTFDVAGIQRLCVSLMSVHRDAFDAGLCYNMTSSDIFAFQAMDQQYNEEDNALMIRYCSVSCSQSTTPGLLAGYFVGCADYILQLFSIQSTGIQDGSGQHNVFYPTAAGSEMLSIKGEGIMYYVNVTKDQNTVLQVNIASSATVQKSVPNQAQGEWSSQPTDFSTIHADTKGVPGAQTLYTALLSKTLSDWQKPQARAPVGLYHTVDNRPWITTETLVIAITISLGGLVLALCYERWFVSPYYTTSFMSNVRAMTHVQGTPKNVFAGIWESGNQGEPAYVTLNSLRLVVDNSKVDVEREFLISGQR